MTEERQAVAWEVTAEDVAAESRPWTDDEVERELVGVGDPALFDLDAMFRRANRAERVKPPERDGWGDVTTGAREWSRARAQNDAALYREATSGISWSGVDARGYPWQESYVPPTDEVAYLLGVATDLEAKGLHRVAGWFREHMVLNALAGLRLKCFRTEAEEFFRVVLGLKFDQEHRTAFWNAVTRPPRRAARGWRDKSPTEMFDALRDLVLDEVGRKAGGGKPRRREVRYAESLGYRPWRRDEDEGEGMDEVDPVERIERVEGEPVTEEEERRDLTALAVKAAKAKQLTLKQAALICRVRGVRGVGVKEARKALKLSKGVERRLKENLLKVGM